MGPVTINLVKYKPVLILKASLVMRDSCLGHHLLCYFGDFNHLHLCIFSELLLPYDPLDGPEFQRFTFVFPSLFTFSLSHSSFDCLIPVPLHTSNPSISIFLDKSLSFPIGPCYLPNFCCYMDCNFL